MATERQQLQHLIDKANRSADSFQRRFCMSCGSPDHEGRCDGAPGPPAPPTHCPYCGTQRGANQMCCEVQDAIAESWIARHELEGWAKNNALSVAHLAVKHGGETGLVSDSKAGSS